MAVSFVSSFLQEFDDVGQLLKNGFYGFFVSGSTDLKNTYPTDGGAATNDPNDNPVPLGNDGRPVVPIFVEEGAYKVILYDSTGTPINELDPYVPVFPSTQDYETGQTYDLNDTVRFDADNFLYVSLKNGNSTSPGMPDANWSRFVLLREWNAQEAYALNAIVIYTDGILYTALGDTTGDIPLSSPNEWKSSATSSLASGKLFVTVEDAGTSVVVTDIGFTPTSLHIYALGGSALTDFRATCYGFANDDVGDEGSTGDVINTTGSRAKFDSETIVFLTDDEPIPAGISTITVASFDPNGFTLAVDASSTMGLVGLIWEAQA